MHTQRDKGYEHPLQWEERSRSAVRQRCTPWEECRQPGRGLWGTEVMCTTFIGQYLRCLFEFGQLSCFFLHSCLVHGPSARCVLNLLLRWIPTQRPMAACLHLFWSGAASLFDSKKPFWTSADRAVSLDFLTSGVVTLSLCLSRAQLLPLALSLECLDFTWILLHLMNTRCPAQRPTISYLKTTYSPWCELS